MTRSSFFITALTAAFLLTAFSSCAKKTEGERLTGIPSVPVSESPSPSATESSSITTSQDSAQTALPIYSSIDFDLTTQSATMIYAQVFNMMLEPDTFNGKIIRLNGACSIFHDESLNKDYYACLVKDATSCCAQGLEFVLAGGDTASYPTENADITITGRFQTYQSHGLDSFHLVDAVLEK